MRLVFDSTGRLSSFSKATPAAPGPGAPFVTIDVEYPAYFVAGVGRAAAAGRVTYQGGQVCLDGTPYTPPVTRAEVTYGAALSAINSATTVAQLRNILLRVADQLLELGALDL